MTRPTRWVVPLMGSLFVLAAAAPTAAQTKERIYRELNPGQIENVLRDMDIKFKRSQPPNKDKDFDFDFERKNYDIRLTLRNGQLVWISAFFPAAPLMKINKWNQESKFSRAVFDSIAGKEYAVVEYQLDASGGVTDNMLKQFIRRFDNEVSRFDEFLRKDQP